MEKGRAMQNRSSRNLHEVHPEPLGSFQSVHAYGKTPQGQGRVITKELSEEQFPEFTPSHEIVRDAMNHSREASSTTLGIMSEL